MTSVLEVQRTATDRNDMFPYTGTGILGATQIIIGVLVFVVGVVDLALTLNSHDSDLQNYGSRYESVVSLTVVSLPLWCGMWFAITGCLGTCMSCDRAQSMQFFKVAFLMLNLLCCALFGPVCAVISIVISYNRHNLAREDYQWLVSLFICFLAVLEVVIATVSASVACCCSVLPSTQIQILVNPGSMRETGSTSFTERKSSTVSGPSPATTNSNINISPNIIPHRNTKNSTTRYEDNKDQRLSPINKHLSVLSHQRSHDQGHVIDGFDGSDGCPVLKKWALPHW